MAKRFNIKGKAYIGTPQKYYFDDLGSAMPESATAGMISATRWKNHLNELRSRGCKVDLVD